MPRRQRMQIESGIYHIMLRGNERKNIFFDKEDKQRMVDILLKVRNDGNFKIYAYCVMDNHLHIVVKDETEGIARIIKRVGTSYAYYYNHKHQRVGHVFQDRFKSEGIKSDAQLLEVIRYVHNNPLNAGIVPYVENYVWSSYTVYMGKGHESQDKALLFKDVENILKMFSTNHDKAIKLFSAFTKERTEEMFLDVDYMEAEKDEKEIEKKMQELLMAKGLTLEIVKDDKVLMEELVRELKFKQGIAGRQIARFLEINRNVVQRIKKT